MASLKAIAAIALTLMIAVPIGLGYGFASTEETVTSWEVESTTNVTDLLLNHNTDYSVEYMNPYNNKELLAVEDSSWTIVAPTYNDTGSTYTSLPNYVTTTGTVSTSVTSTTYTPTGSTMIGSDGVSGANVTITSPMVYFHDYGTTTTAVVEGYLSEWENGDYGDGYIWFSAASPIEAYMSVNGSDSWLIQSGSTQYTWEDWVLDVYSESTFVLTTSEYVLVDPGTNDISFTTSDLAALKIVTSSSTYYETVTSATAVLLTAAGAATVGSTTYENVTGFYIAEQPSVSSITYSYTAADSDGYADPAGGWTHGYNPVWWLNGQENESVRIMLNIPAGTYCAMGPTNTIEAADEVYIGYDGTTMTVSFSNESYELGNYSYAMVVFTRTEATVYGLTSWPTLGVWPTTYNSITADYDDLDEAFRYLYIQGGTTSSISYRVDLAEVVAGTYPSTYNLTFEPYDYYPDVSYTFTIKSVALYGEGLTIVSRDNDTTTGLVFEVEDGKITVNDTAMSVRGLEITTRKNSDDTWNTYVGGELVWESTDLQPYIDIYGHWSLTASLDVLTETTSTQQTWAPGEFAFDKEDFAACGLLVAGACLVGLGMTGSRSGAKMGVLLMICGGAGLIYLTLI